MSPLRRLIADDPVGVYAANVSDDTSNEVKMPLRCVIDCDPGCDDVLALLLALSSPELLILSIITTHGNTDLGHCTANARKTLAAVARHVRLHPAQREKWPGLDGELRRSYGLGPIQLIQGAERPIEGEPVTAKYFHGRSVKRPTFSILVKLTRKTGAGTG